MWLVQGCTLGGQLGPGAPLLPFKGSWCSARGYHCTWMKPFHVVQLISLDYGAVLQGCVFVSACSKAA